MKIRNLLIVSIIAILVAGCNTVAGVGKDVQAGGKSIQRAAH